MFLANDLAHLLLVSAELVPWQLHSALAQGGLDFEPLHHFIVTL